MYAVTSTFPSGERINPLDTFTWVGLLMEAMITCQMGKKHTRAMASRKSTATTRNTAREGDTRFNLDLFTLAPSP